MSRGLGDVYKRQVRELRKNLPLAQAMEQAVTECIHNDILTDFLHKNRSEVIKVGIYEYDEELHIQNERAYAREEGLTQGLAQGLVNGLHQAALIQKHLNSGDSPAQIADLLNIDLETITNYCRLLSDTDAGHPSPNVP